MNMKSYFEEKTAKDLKNSLDNMGAVVEISCAYIYKSII